MLQVLRLLSLVPLLFHLPHHATAHPTPLSLPETTTPRFPGVFIPPLPILHQALDLNLNQEPRPIGFGVAAVPYNNPNPHGHPAFPDHEHLNSYAKRTPGGVRICTEGDFGGYCWYGVYPINTCVGLGSFTGNIGSFRPDEPTDCFLMQGGCNSNRPFADIYHDSAEIGSLSEYPWISEAASYICFNDQFRGPQGDRNGEDD